MDLVTVLTSAAVGSLASAVVVSVNGYFERRARRDQTLFSLAFDLAKDRQSLLIELIKGNPHKRASFRDTVFLGAEYYNWLRHLEKHGDLPDVAYKREQASRRK